LIRACLICGRRIRKAPLYVKEILVHVNISQQVVS
jgi:hypothetical protein